LSNDWMERYGHPVLVVETFVDPQLFRSTVYRASSRKELGLTQGNQRVSRDYYEPHDVQRECPHRRASPARMAAAHPWSRPGAGNRRHRWQTRLARCPAQLSANCASDRARRRSGLCVDHQRQLLRHQKAHRVETAPSGFPPFAPENHIENFAEHCREDKTRQYVTRQLVCAATTGEELLFPCTAQIAPPPPPAHRPQPRDRLPRHQSSSLRTLARAMARS
jgi:hypothetical protein